MQGWFTPGNPELSAWRRSFFPSTNVLSDTGQVPIPGTVHVRHMNGTFWKCKKRSAETKHGYSHYCSSVLRVPSDLWNSHIWGGISTYREDVKYYSDTLHIQVHKLTWCAWPKKSTLCQADNTRSEPLLIKGMLLIDNLCMIEYGILFLEFACNVSRGTWIRKNGWTGQNIGQET